MYIFTARTILHGIKATSQRLPHTSSGIARIHVMHTKRSLVQPYVLSSYPTGYFFASSNNQSQLSAFRFQNLHTTGVVWDSSDPLKPSSKVEESVIAFKDDLKKQLEKQKSADQVTNAAQTAAVVKPSIGKRIMDELKHYYHGFRLLFIDVKISWNLLMRILKGEALTRREKKQLVRTSSDVFRLVPFSVFIIVPFMEFTLPIFLKLFPNMLPSTFQTANEKEAKIKTSLKVKLEMAKFLQQTLDEMSLKGNGHQSNTAKEFAEFFVKIRSSGQHASNEEILRFSKLFEDEITLDSLSRPQLSALCRVLEITPIGTNNLLRFQLRMKLRSLAADDKVIQKEGIDSLSISELQSACRARGMRALGVSEIRLKSQLLQWLDLSLNEKVPPSLLLLSRALFLPDSDLTSEQLKATIASLPESVATQTRDAISQRRGKIDNEARIKALKVEEAMIREERKEAVIKATPVAAVAAEAGSGEEELVDKAPVMKDKATELTSADVAALENALESIGVQRKRLLIEKEELTELKEEMAEYQEDIKELKDFLDDSAQQQPPERKRLVLRESKAAQRLFRSVNRMISNLDGTVNRLEGRAARKGKETTDEVPQAVVEEIVSIEELISSLRRLQAVDNSEKLQQIIQLLGQIDQDRDGVVKVDDIMKIIELLGEEEIHMSPKQMTEMLNLVSKEEILEMEEKVEKALGQTKKAAEHVVATAVKAGFPSAADELPSISIEQIPVKESEKSVNTTKEPSSDEETKKKKNRSSNP